MARFSPFRIGLWSFLLLALGCSSAFSQKTPSVNIIPKPAGLTTKTGSFSLTRESILVCPEIAVAVASDMANRLGKLVGKPLKVVTSTSSAKSIIEMVAVRDESMGDEGYLLDVAPNRIRIAANSKSGFLYGAQTLYQLLPVDVFGVKPPRKKSLSIPCLEIKDSPRFSWRGMHLDVSRHFLPKEFIKTYIDILAMHKMNIFHWHLTDDQGWRLEIRKYPLLTEVAAWRVDREHQPWSVRDPQRPGEKPTLGGFYTQDDVREIVKYAAGKNITVVPEIEMPAHTTALLAAYPQFSCTGGPFTVPPGGVWPITDIFCAGNDSTFLFLQDILTEVIELFPSSFIHIGGDEADKKEWKVCSKCQARIKNENLKDEAELQSYFVQRIERFLNSRGRRLIGWDEILEGGLAPNAAVMSWRGTEGGYASAKQGHDAVMTPLSHTYFNCYQGKESDEPLSAGGYLPLSKVYNYEPVPEGLTNEEAQRIIGAQACLWGEFVSTPERAMYMVLPRLAALAEVVWSPREARNWKDFTGRLSTQLKRYEAAGYPYSKSAYNALIIPGIDSTKKRLVISIENEMNYPLLYYTLDGSEPTTSSRRYTKPIPISKTTKIKAGAFFKGKLLGAVTDQEVFVHKASFKSLTLRYPYERYTAGGPYGLVNGLRGNPEFSDGNWQGYHQFDLDAVIDMGKQTSIKRIAAGFLDNTNSWIFFPTRIEFHVSNDNKEYKKVAEFDFPVPTAHRPASIKELSQSLPNMKARYVRVFAKNVGLCPDWHTGKGDKAWLFIDEIVVE